MNCRPTFYRIYKKKSTEGFQSVPYLVALFSATLWLYYAMLKQNAVLLITINTFGSVIETLYIAMYIVYATKDSRVRVLRKIRIVNRIEISIASPCWLGNHYRITDILLLNLIECRNILSSYSAVWTWDFSPWFFSFYSMHFIVKTVPQFLDGSTLPFQSVFLQRPWVLW